MSLETASFIKGLVATNPEGTDPKSQGDDHLRLLKAVLQSQFSGFTDGVPITRKESEINAMLIAGAFGLGGNAIPFAEANGLPHQSGFYVYNGGGVSNPPGAALGDLMIHLHGVLGSGETAQIWFKNSNSFVFVRAYAATSYTAWKSIPLGPNQTSLVDSTPGAILQAGSFGLGINGSNQTLINIDDPYLLDAMYGVPPGFAGTAPSGGIAGDMLLVLCYSAGHTFQIWAGQNGLLYVRRRLTGAWLPWMCLNGLGQGQSWQNLLASRAIGTSYTNTTNRSIEVQVTASSTVAGAFISGYQNGIEICRVSTSESNGVTWQAVAACFSMTVPPGGTYAALQTGANSLVLWNELR